MDQNLINKKNIVQHLLGLEERRYTDLEWKFHAPEYGLFAKMNKFLLSFG